jgi:hypothetical protein
MPDKSAAMRSVPHIQSRRKTGLDVIQPQQRISPAREKCLATSTGVQAVRQLRKQKDCPKAVSCISPGEAVHHQDKKHKREV